MDDAPSSRRRAAVRPRSVWQNIEPRPSAGGPTCPRMDEIEILTNEYGESKVYANEVYLLRYGDGYS